MNDDFTPIGRRFRGFLPVVVDVETGGFIPATDALLEMAAVFVECDQDGALRRGRTVRYHVRPFEGSRVDPASLAVNGIDPWHPLRPAVEGGGAAVDHFVARAVRLARGRDLGVGHRMAAGLAGHCSTVMMGWPVPGLTDQPVSPTGESASLSLTAV